MKRIAILFLSLLSLTSVMQAQLLWEITGKGLESPSYLFGTHHIAPLSVLDSVAGFAEAFASAEKIYGEVDMSAMADMSTQMKMAQRMQAPADSTLSRVLTPAQITTLDSVIRVIGAPFTATMLEPMKPAAVSNALTMFITAREFPEFDQTKQLDMTIQQMARENNKAVGGLESIDDQLSILFDTPISRQAESLVKSIADLDKTCAMAHTMANAYMAQDLNRLQSMIQDPDCGMTPEDTDALINRRNAAWVEFLLGVLPTASVLVVVGAGHLPGDKGVINLLRKAGYDVEPM